MNGRNCLIKSVVFFSTRVVLCVKSIGAENITVEAVTT